MEVMEPCAGYLATPAFKPTDLGTIPVDWQVKQIGDFQPFITSGSRGWAAFYSGFGSLFVRITNLTRERIYLDLEDVRFVNVPSTNSEGSRTELRDGDVLISITADIGIVGYVTESVPKPSYINQHIALVRFDPANVCPLYVSYFLASESVQRLFRALTDSGAKAGMNLATVRQVRLAVPSSLEEQQAIATAMSDADALVESLEQLLAKKRQIKQGAMQELLTGKHRLPGFSEKWRSVSLDAIGKFSKGAGITREQAQSGTIPCIRYGEIYTSHHDCIREFYSWISETVAGTAIRLRKGDLLFAGSGETKEEIGKCVAFLGDFKTYAGGDIVILRPEGCDSMFLGYALNIAPVVRQKASFGQGDAVVHISAASLGRVVVQMPEQAEQTAIAEVLSDMDAEITTLEAKLAKARAIKQGMMQELLTGRIRLV